MPVGIDVVRDGSCVRLAVSGEIDLSNAADLQRTLTSEVTGETTEVEVDLSDVGYIDSAALRVLFALASRLKLSQTNFAIVAPPGSPARFAIEVSGMASLCDVRPEA